MHRRIKVLFLIPSFNVAGLESQLAKLLNVFDDTKFELHVAALFFYPNRPSITERFPAYVITHRVYFLQWYNPISWFRLFRILGAVKPDIVFGSMFPGNAAAVIGHLFFRYKVVTREHNLYPEKTALHLIFDKISSYFASRIVTVSKGVASFASQQMRIPQEKFLVIENGIDVNEIIKRKETISSRDVQLIRDEFGLANEEKIMLSISRLKKQKNLPLMIDAYEKYRALGGMMRLFILSDGAERVAIQEYIDKKSLGQYVTLAGHRPDVGLFFSLASIFVLSSKKEGFANVVLESLAFGVPVVSTHVPGSVDIIKNGYNGFLVTDDATIMGQAMKELESMSSEVGDQCIESVWPFDIQVTVKKYSDLITSLVEKTVS